MSNIPDIAIDKYTILAGYRGSIAHGMYIPSSDPKSIDDKDIMSVCVPPIDYYFGLCTYGSHGTKEIKRDEWDIVIYEAIKFIRLLNNGNPNVLSLLWLEDNFYLKKSDAGKLLLENRDLFSCKSVFKSFSGYAYGQLHRMTHGTSFLGHMGEKRRMLVEKFGYDCKNASHLIRLLRMGTEFLAEGRLYVLRSRDATQLLEIKRGEWTLEQVQSEADKWFNLINEAYIRSSLPDRIDIDRINKLTVEIIKTTQDKYRKDA